MRCETTVSVLRLAGARSERFVVFARFVTFIGAAALAACGTASSPASPTPPSQAPPAGSAEPPTVTLSAAGFIPQEITVAVGGRVTFVNVDRIGHDIASGIDHTARECPEVDAVGFLVAGQNRDTSAFAEAKTCRFHDHDNVGNPAFQGRIVAR
jgi:plastocyanin